VVGGEPWNRHLVIAPNRKPRMEGARILGDARTPFSPALLGGTRFALGANGFFVSPRRYAMRVLCFLFLVLFAGAAGAFAWFNQQDVTLQFFDRAITLNISALIGIVYALGMLSGWTVVGMVRRSIHRVTDRPLVLERDYSHAR
jgi:uncharacterized membrane protein YciS (DUF1049 family)